LSALEIICAAHITELPSDAKEKVTIGSAQMFPVYAQAVHPAPKAKKKKQISLSTIALIFLSFL